MNYLFYIPFPEYLLPVTGYLIPDFTVCPEHVDVINKEHEPHHDHGDD